MGYKDADKAPPEGRGTTLDFVASMHEELKRLARRLLGDYRMYFIFRAEAAATSRSVRDVEVCRVDREAIEASPDQILRDEAWYSGDGAHAFGAFQDGQLVGVCFFWSGARYRERGFWPLAEGEAKLVQILVSPTARNRGIGATLIAAATERLWTTGFRQLYARVWYNHQRSLRAFAAAGWARIGFVLQVDRPLSSRPICLRLRWDGRRRIPRLVGGGLRPLPSTSCGPESVQSPAHNRRVCPRSPIV